MHRGSARDSGVTKRYGNFLVSHAASACHEQYALEKERVKQQRVHFWIKYSIHEGNKKDILGKQVVRQRDSGTISTRRSPPAC